MLTFNELVELRDKLVKGEIQLEPAKAQFWNDFTEGQRSWHTKDWKERRSKFLKEKCEICSSKDILTVQHRSHPGKFSEHKVKVTREHAKDYINSNPVLDKLELNNHILRAYDYEPILLCPNCKSKNPNKRVRKTPKFRCADCKHEFDEAIFRTVDELVSFFLKMSMRMKFETSVLLQGINGETGTIFQVLGIGYKERVLRTEMQRQLRKKHF